MHISKGKVTRALFAPAVWAAKLLGEHFPEQLVTLRYMVRFGKRPDLTNPKTLNEKILHLSLRSDTALWTRLADKYAVREYVRERGLGDILVKLHAHWRSGAEVDFTDLPDSFVIKSVQGSGDVIIVDDKSAMDLTRVRAAVNAMLRERYGALEGGKHYMRIPPAVVVEELLPATDGRSLTDYKIWCFNGIARYIWVCRNRTKSGVAVMTYDTGWNAHPEYSRFTSGYYRDDVVAPPGNLHEMLAAAERLAAGMPVVRVDLYNVDGRIYFGEMTFTSLGGLMDFYTDEFQLMAGGMIDLNHK